ncbi:MAG: hypothetical protein ABI451_11245 [Dokdonella sp.]
MNAYRKSSCFAAAAICLAMIVPSQVSAQAPTGPSSTLAPGVLVGGADFPSSAWIADDVGRVAAINLDNGAMNWRGPAEGLPLALVDGKLVVLGRPERSGQMSLLLLDPASGSSVGTLLGQLPEGVLASPYAQPNRIFKAVADNSTGTLRVFWTYSEWPLRGALLVNDATPDAGRRELNGVMTVDFPAHTLKLSSTAGAPANVAADLTGNERVPGVEGTQFRSADGTYALAASPVDDDVLGTAWRWTLHERGSARTVAQLQLPYSHAPFLVRANRLFWQSPPIAMRQASGEYLQQSLRLVCQDLTSGRELWSVNLLDQKFRGVLPP